MNIAVNVEAYVACGHGRMCLFLLFLLSYPWHVQSLDKNCLGPLRKAYCGSLNLLLRREVREPKSSMALS